VYKIVVVKNILVTVTVKITSNRRFNVLSMQLKHLYDIQLHYAFFVSTFDIADITSPNGTITNLTVDSSNTVYTATFTPAADTNIDTCIINGGQESIMQLNVIQVL
jgi:hypothetical protein